MKPISTKRMIAADLPLVFQTIADVRNFSKAVPHITNIEFLSEQHSGPGTQFRETREMNGREQSVDMEVAEYIENDRVRMVSDAGGTIWDTLFTVADEGNEVAMTMVMEIRPYRLLAKVMTPLIRGMVVKGVEADMDAVKEYCEGQ